jgi:hypothetical protein
MIEVFSGLDIPYGPGIGGDEHKVCTLVFTLLSPLETVMLFLITDEVRDKGGNKVEGVGVMKDNEIHLGEITDLKF